MSERVDTHIRSFNSAVRGGDWASFTATFTPDAVMRFEGVPAGPYAGREAIATAYAENPPTDTMTAGDVSSDGDTDTVRFAWDEGGTGTMRLTWRDGSVAVLTVIFDPPAS